MRDRQRTGFMGEEESRTSPLSVALQELLSAIHGRSLESGHRARVSRHRTRAGSGPFTRYERRRRNQPKLPKDKSLAIIQASNRLECVQSTMEYPLHFDIIKSDGGEFNSYNYPISNILKDDEFVYSSQKNQNINVVFKFNPGVTGVADPSCVITNAVAQAPAEGFTAPCTELVLFISHKAITIEEMAKYDNITEEEYLRCKKQPTMFPWRVPGLPVDAYFTLKKSQHFLQNLSIPFRMARYIGIKLIRSDGDQDNIDFQYFSVKGFSGPRSFYKADLN